jgi:hypothetical protein
MGNAGRSPASSEGNVVSDRIRGLERTLQLVRRRRRRSRILRVSRPVDAAVGAIDRDLVLVVAAAPALALDLADVLDPEALADPRLRLGQGLGEDGVERMDGALAAVRAAEGDDRVAAEVPGALTEGDDLADDLLARLGVSRRRKLGVELRVQALGGLHDLPQMGGFTF